MEDRKKELLKKIATEFPTLKESEKYYIAGYISHAEDTRVEKMEVRTAQSARKENAYTEDFITDGCNSQ